MLNSSNIDISRSLLNQLDCLGNNITTEIATNEIYTTKLTGKSPAVTDIKPSDNALKMGFKLGYVCTNSSQPNDNSNYWTLTQLYNTDSLLSPEEAAMKNEIFAAREGFGFFVFE